MTRLDGIKARVAAQKHWHESNGDNQYCKYAETPYPDMEWLIEKLELAQKALEFYADLPLCGINRGDGFETDGGDVARKALEEMK